ncbi:hypothetical protein [Pontibacter pamirensis]|uniref:hypothetical protein n=1 Tax=Pontibacter pamirensis TaxID=2562824 RepID=UPI001389BB65|nr:hypothetical protein [Pontibacter pamirensis]
MKKLLILTCMVFSGAFAASAQDTPGISAQERATNLSHEMIRDLRLNNYQSTKVNEINLDVAKQMLAIEKQYAGNQEKINELCNGVCAERDLKLENVLSTVQYNEYFGDRKNLVALDRQFMSDTNKSRGGNGVASSETASGSSRTVSIN